MPMSECRIKPCARQVFRVAAFASKLAPTGIKSITIVVNTPATCGSELAREEAGRHNAGL
ncbi:hypothetical protein EMIT0347P_100155 [Pseudomonas sp. IT-347P]